MKAHGIIMVLTWIILVSTGVLVSRYFKQSWRNRQICGKAVWFAIHRAIMICVAILTLIAFFLIVIYKKGEWVTINTKRELAHSIIGIFVISFAVVQPFMAIFRCNPTNHYRYIFNYAHATIGFSAFILSIVAIFLAMFFTRFTFQTNKEWGIVVTWLCWLPIIFLTFEIIDIYFRKNSSSTKHTNSYDMDDRHGNNTTNMENLQIRPKVNVDQIKTLLLLLHIVIAFGLALGLIIVIGKM